MTLSASDTKFLTMILRGMQNDCARYDECVKELAIAAICSDCLADWPEMHLCTMVSNSYNNLTLQNIHAGFANQLVSIRHCDAPKDIRSLYEQYCSAERDMKKYILLLLKSMVRRGRLAQKIIIRRWSKLQTRFLEKYAIVVDTIHVGRGLYIPASLQVYEDYNFQFVDNVRVRD